LYEFSKKRSKLFLAYLLDFEDKMRNYQRIALIPALTYVLLAQGTQYIGAGGCSSSNCHGSTAALPERDSRILGNEYSVWSVRDKHAKAYTVLDSPRSRRMAEILKIGDPQTAQRCLVCHAVGSPTKSISDGVACEACHGPAEKWLGPHTQPNSHAASVAAGMIDLRDLNTRASNCLSCHMGSNNRLVDHELIAAGHPDLVFELDTFGAAQPMHYRDPKPAGDNSLPHARAWAVGQAMATAGAMRLVAAHARDNWPEFSDLECYQCHHDLRAESWRIQRGYGNRKPGSLQMNLSHAEILRRTVPEIDRSAGAAFADALARLEAATAGGVSEKGAVADAARGLQTGAEALAARLAQTDFTADKVRAALRSLDADARRLAGLGVETAEQATMTLDSLGSAVAADQTAFQAAVAKLYDFLEHPSTYQPAAFAAEFHRAAASVR
jgi:hypothetical protein